MNYNPGKTHSSWTHPLLQGLPTTGEQIEKRSSEIIAAHLEGLTCSTNDKRIIQRVVHATADVSFAQSMRIHPDAVTAGVHALSSGAPVITDVRMLQAGITRALSQIHCVIDDADVLMNARMNGTTRAATAMIKLGSLLHGAVVAIGNAPTAIWQLLAMHYEQGITPALVVGLPVGFVGASESKQALWESDLVSVTNSGPRGGSATAAAAVNAIALMAAEMKNG